MPITRRQFCKQTAGVVSVSVVMPKLWLKGEARAQAPEAAPGRKFIVLQLLGGNDGLNTLIPYSDSRYHALRPTLGFSDSEISQTTLDANFALHPSMTAMKSLYDQGKVAIVAGVGYPNPNLSHFTSMDIWHSADPLLQKTEGWLGTYADVALVGKTLPWVAVDSESPFTMRSPKVVVPDLAPSATAFTQYTFQTDAKYPGDSTNQRNVWNTIYNRSFDSSSFLGQVAGTGLSAVTGADTIRTSVTSYTSTVTYANNTTLGIGLKMVAQLITTIPDFELLYVTLGGFDHHSAEIGDNANPTNRLVGQHATLLGEFSDGINTFYQDLTNHGLADQVVIMQWSEFGRRPQENASRGTDHGTASPLFVIGNPVKGGHVYGQQPSLDVTQLDGGGNPKMQVDFRAVYGTILDKWLGADSKSILGGSFEDVGFLG
jgi:uncharacterized protein (DUF1501 family)